MTQENRVTAVVMNDSIAHAVTIHDLILTALVRCDLITPGVGRDLAAQLRAEAAHSDGAEVLRTFADYIENVTAE